MRRCFSAARYCQTINVTERSPRPATGSAKHASTQSAASAGSTRTRVRARADRGRSRSCASVGLVWPDVGKHTHPVAGIGRVDRHSITAPVAFDLDRDQRRQGTPPPGGQAKRRIRGTPGGFAKIVAIGMPMQVRPALAPICAQAQRQACFGRDGQETGQGAGVAGDLVPAAAAQERSG